MIVDYCHLVEAINVVNGWLSRENVFSGYVLHLVDILVNCKISGCFDGTVDSAYQCLLKELD